MARVYLPQPSFEERVAIYERCAKELADNALVHQGYGGVLVIVHPRTQRDEGIEELCLYTAGMGPHPDDKMKG